MKKRLKRTTKQYIVVSLLSIIIIGGAFLILYFTVIHQMKGNYQDQIKVLAERLESHKLYVYEAKVDITAGTKITKENVNYVQAYSNQEKKYFMSSSELGMVSLIDISKGTQIIKGMLTKNDLDSNVREIEYNAFKINSNMKENDCADLRIRFPNGEDYVVLSMKSFKNLTLETNNCFLWLTEEEILNMSAALVDAYLYSGTILYTAKYIEPSLQKASVVTYNPSLATLTIMEQDENIVDRASKELSKRLRKEMEQRLAEQMMESSSGNIPRNISENDTSQPEDKTSTEEYLTDGEDVVEYGE